MTEKLKAEWLIDNGSMEDAIEECIRDYVWKQKRAYGVEVDPKDIDVDPRQFLGKIQKWLDWEHSFHDNPFENENEATEYWLDYEGYELIRKAIESA